jgi:mono/diheme cytochrome c family protein
VFAPTSLLALLLLADAAQQHDDVAFALEARERALRPLVAERVRGPAAAGDVVVVDVDRGAGVHVRGTVYGDVEGVKDGVVVSRCPVVVDGGFDVRQIVSLRDRVVVLSGVGHRVFVYDVDDAGVVDCGSVVVARFDSPLFALGARERKDIVDGVDVVDVVDVVVSGIEDLPLHRVDGGFDNIDSFAFGLRIVGRGRAATVERTFERNLSALGVVSGARVDVDSDSDSVTITSVASGQRVRLRSDGHVEGVDAIDVGGHGDNNADNNADNNNDEVALGRRLVFTTLLAPGQTSEGPRSRFTCEACHLDGGVDGRVHNTGRLDGTGHAVTASTKPLWGLFQNPPLFSRALDRSVGVMVHAEFKVANRGGGDPWFGAEGKSPEALRAAMLTFFAHFDPPARPPVVVDDVVRAGAAVFRVRCAGCHPARVFANDASSAVDVDVALQRPRAYVWARDGHEDVGIRPLVHPDGARPSSLRDVAWKTPLFTNGQARTLQEAVAQVRVGADGRVVHADVAGRAGVALDVAEQHLLLAFLCAL